MAYTYVPTTTKDITALNSKFDSELNSLLLYLQQKTKMDDPITIDKNNPKFVKVLRVLSSKVTKSELTKLAPSLNIDFGNGSRGGRGAGNKGMGFERELAQDLRLYISEGLSAEFSNKDFIHEIVEEYHLKDKKLSVDDTLGAKNQARSLVFTGGQPYIKGPDFNIGSILTDLDIIADNKRIHLSAKFGKTVTFFNSGIMKILPEKDIKANKLSKEGMMLLDLFGIDYVKFCNVFNQYNSKPTLITENTFSKIDKNKLKKFLMSGIGYGYHLVHKIGKEVHHKRMEKADLEKYATPLSCMIRYPIGTAKRVDVFVETPVYKLKINIRNKQGGVYPSHIMSDYEAKY